MADLRNSIPRIDRPSPSQRPWEVNPRSELPRLLRRPLTFEDPEFRRLMHRDFVPGEAQRRLREAYTRSVSVPGMILRRVLGLGVALMWPDRLGDGTLTPEVRRELERLERQGLGYLAERAEMRTVANRRIMGPPAALEYAADQFDQGNWAPASVPSSVPTLVQPAPLQPSQLEALPFLPDAGSPRASETSWSDVPNPRDRRLARLAEEDARDRLRRAARTRAVIRETNERMAALADRLDRRLAEASAVNDRLADQFEAAHQARVERELALQEYQSLVQAEERRLREFERELRRLEAEHDQAVRRKDEVERAEAPSSRSTRVQRQAAQQRQVGIAVQLEFLHGFPEPTVQRFGFDGGGSGTGRKTSRFQQPQNDRKTGSRLYRFGLMLISRTYGRIDEGLDVLIAMADNVHYADGLADGVAHGDVFLQGERSTPRYYRDIVAGLGAGDLELDVVGFGSDLVAMQFEDWLFGQAGHASRELAHYMGRPVGVAAGPAL